MPDVLLMCSIFLAVDGSREGLDLRSLASLTPGVDISGAEMQAAEVLVIQGARLAGLWSCLHLLETSASSCQIGLEFSSSRLVFSNCLALVKRILHTGKDVSNKLAVQVSETL